MTSSCRIEGPGSGGTGYLLFDSGANTGISVKNGTKIGFTASKPIRFLYLVWDTPHDRWNFVSLKNGEENRVSFGNNGFFHDYADLGDAYDSITLEFFGTGSILCDIYAFSEGEIPNWVQIWQPPLEKADLLVIPARAGDEFLYFGGTIPYYLEKGKTVQAAYMTNLFEEPLKTHELLNALYASGLRVYPVISDFSEVTAATAESAAEYYDENEVLEFVTGLLRRFKPDVVVGQGDYGDGVQKLSYNALTIAAELSGEPLEYVESAEDYGVWDVPKIYLHSNGQPGNEEEIEMSWENSIYIAKQAFANYSWRQNRSIAEEGAYDCRKFRLYRTTVGSDLEKNDFFENIGFETSPESELEAEALPQLPAFETETATDDGFAVENGIGKLLGSPFTIPISAGLMIMMSLLLRLKKD